LIVFNEHKVLYTRQQNFGAKQLVQQIRREYGVNNQDAETLIVSESPPDDYYSAVLVPYFKSAGQELSRALQFFFSSSSFSKIDNVVLTGGVSGLPDFSDHLSTYFESRNTTLNPIEKISTFGDKKNIKKSIGGLSTALGLALRGFH